MHATLAQPGELSVRVVDMLGREVATLADGPAQAGLHRFTIESHRLPSGVYTVVMDTEGVHVARRVVVTR